MSRYGVARLDEIDEVTDGREPWRPVRAHFGIRSFGVNAWTGKETGDRIINEHDEEGEDEELYVVQSGRARFELDGESVDAPTGTYVFVEPGVKRTAYAEEAGTTLLAIGARAGKAYEPSGWELWAPIAPLYQSGQYEEVADLARPLVDAHPEYPVLAYNLACVESLVGRKEDAIEHLRQAAEKSERLREFAIDDSDLDAIRDDPRFKELVGA
jgi:quercetin dioxygenase-like cupin family protein